MQQIFGKLLKFQPRILHNGIISVQKKGIVLENGLFLHFNRGFTSEDRDLPALTPDLKRTYKNDDDVYRQELHFAGGAIYNSHNPNDIAKTFTEYQHCLTSNHISYAIDHIANHQLDLDHHFWSVIYPRVKQEVISLDRYCAVPFVKILYAISRIALVDKELWEIFEEKLIQEKLIRYLTPPQLIKVLNSFANMKKGSDILFQEIEKRLIKHQKELDHDLALEAKAGFQLAEKGSEGLIKLLEEF